MLTVRGHGVLTIGDKEIPFENKVNTNFLMAPMNLIDLQEMGGGPYESYGLMNLPCNSFQILSNPYDQDMNKLYNRLAFVGISSFTAAIQKPTKVVLRGGGQFHTAGVARSAGFNVVCAEGAFAGVIPYVNVPRRRARVRVTGVSAVPFTGTWVYHPTKKALYGYRNDSSEIWKIGFDIDTGVYSGDPVLLTDQFTFVGDDYTATLTDGVSKLFRFTPSSGNSVNSFMVYDLEAEQLSTVPLSSTIYIYRGHNDKFWDDLNKKIYIQGVTLPYTDLHEIDPDNGQVERKSFPGQTSGFNTVYVLKDYYMLDERAVRPRFESTNLALSSTSTGSGFFRDYFNKSYRFPDSNGWVITGTFDSTNSPGSLQLQMVKEPDMAYTMIAIPPTEVEVDTPFSIEYTLEVVGG